MKQTLVWCGVRVAIGAACVLGAIGWNGGNTCQGQTPATPSPGLEEVVKLTKAQMGDDVIIKYINNSATTFQLSADDILYLKNQGVSQPVISALLQAKGAPAAAAVIPAPVAAPAPAPAPPVAPQPAVSVVIQAPGLPSAPPPPPPPVAPTPEINFTYFHDQLAPFGTWVDVGGVMYWRPDQALKANPDWRPYYDMGHWTQTENGLFWQSDYNWGDIPFHYGRWVRDPVMGWLWAPDYTWGPAWVFWRHAEVDAAIGWAPLPVGAVFVEDGFMFHGARVAVDFDFGLGDGVFVFVDYDHFHEPFFRMRGREWAWHIHGDRFHDFYRRSVIRNEFRRDEHGRFVNHGIGRERMEQVTKGRVERASFQERKPVGDRAALAKESKKEGEKGEEKSREKAGEKGAEKPGQKAGEKGAEKSVEKAPAAPSKVFRPPAPAASRPAASPAASKPAPSSSSSGSKKK